MRGRASATPPAAARRAACPVCVVRGPASWTLPGSEDCRVCGMCPRCPSRRRTGSATDDLTESGRNQQGEEDEPVDEDAGHPEQTVSAPGTGVDPRVARYDYEDC